MDCSYLYSLHAFPNCGIFIAKQFLKRKKKVISWRTDDKGEDMALRITQKKEKGLTEKTPQNSTKIRKKYFETTGKEKVQRSMLSCLIESILGNKMQKNKPKILLDI